MYLALQPQPDYCKTWLAAVESVLSESGHEANNVIMDVASLENLDQVSSEVVATVNAFLLKANTKPLMTVANSIFPSGLYQRHGRAGIYEAFHERLLPKVRRGCNWTGYYFERMTKFRCSDGKYINPLDDVIDRLADPAVTSRNKYEICIFDPERDLSRSPYGGQCLSYLSFKLAGPDRRLTLTAYYRNHYYIEKLLGNLIGLSQLLSYVATESNYAPGSLTILSGHAKVDVPGSSRLSEVRELIKQCKAIYTSQPA